MKSPLCLQVLVIAVLFCAVSGPAAQAQGAPPSRASSSPGNGTAVAIPGPLRSFLRMAGISQKASPEDVLPLLARNVFSHGYEGSPSGGRQTEFLILLIRYVDQSRQLAALAGPQATLNVTNCSDAGPLLEIIGYRAREDCGQPSTFLETADPQKAFITIDSGFPLPELEDSLRHNKPFSYPYPTTRVPALFTENDWVAAEKGHDKDLVETILHDRALARLYWGMTRIDAETQVALQHSPGIRKLAPLAAPLAFYGSHLQIRSGRVLVPGGTDAEPTWKDLVGVSPDNTGEFVLKLLSKDNAWLAAYYDALSRVNGSQRAHFVQPDRLRRSYEALRGQDSSPDAARPVFRPDPGLLLLLTRLQWDANGGAHVPGNLEVWKKVLSRKGETKISREWSKRAGRIMHNDQLVDALFGLSRVQTDSGPLQAFLMLSELDSKRPTSHKLAPETVAAMAAKFSDLSNQYLIFSEFPELNDASIMGFLRAANALTDISNHILRGNALGTFQGNVGMWQIFARQRQIPEENLNSTFQKVIKPFDKFSSPGQLFDSGRSSLRELILAVTGRPNASEGEIIELLAGPRQQNPEAQQVHDELVSRMRAILDGQRLVSLDTLLALGDGLHNVAEVTASANTLLPLAGELREFELPRPIFKNSEREEWAAGIYNNRHTELQMKTDLTKVIKTPGSAEQLADARGQLAPFLRDTLVGLNYAYYEPPGAQVLHYNPLFVRSHDFSGETVTGMEQIWQAPRLFGAGSPAGGGAHLVGSLADLPYVLAQAEQDFITPENVQALIWQEVVPGLLTSAIIPRWWDVSRNELHAVALYQKMGEELLNASAGDEKLRVEVMRILSDRMVPQRSERIEAALREGRVEDIYPRLMPADTFYLAAEYRESFPDRTDTWGSAAKELDALIRRYPNEVGWKRLSHDFGVPHPVLAQSYARELLNLEPFPAFTGYSSRLLAETWDSNNLYWARLADEKGYAPALLTRLVPELTRRMVEKIFATDLEDWPALLRATRETGDEFREGKVASLSEDGTIAP